MCKKLSVLAVVVSFLCLSAASALAAQLTVDQNDPGCSDPLGAPFCTIQAAIDAAVSFDTIKVKKGTYAEDLSITTDNVTLEGEGKNNTTILGVAFDTGPFPLATPNIDIKANGVSISKFTIESPDLTTSGQYTSGVVFTGTNITFSHNNFVASSGDPGSVAMQSWNTAALAVTPADISGLLIEKNHFSSKDPNATGNFGYEGIFINPQGGTIDTTNPVRLEKNKFEGDLYRAIGIARSRVYAEKNDMETTLVGPLATTDFGDVPWGIKVFSGSTAVHVEKNKIKDKPGTFNIGIYFDASTSGGIVEKNDVKGAAALSGVDTGAITMRGSGHTVEKNKVKQSANDGILLRGSGHTAEKNDVKDSADDGMELRGSSHTAEKNTLKKSGDVDLEDNSTGSVFVKNKCKTSDPAGLCT